MPGKNINKEYVSESYYHIYNRGVNKEPVFLDEKDYTVFLGLLKRYLDKEVQNKPNREPYPNYHDDIELLAFCLMRNHFHLFIFQHSEKAITNLLKSVTVAYSMYFNKRYKRVGPVFQQRYRAVRMYDDGQLLHISRYIHMNPKQYSNYKWSSLPYYLHEKQADWVRPHRVLELFDDKASYANFLKEYEHRRDELIAFKEELANG